MVYFFRNECLRRAWRQWLLSILVMGTFVACAHKNSTRPLKEILPQETAKEVRAAFNTSAGDFEVLLFHQDAPKTVQNFIDLAEGKTAWKHPGTGDEQVGVRYYDGLIFHRVVPDFMVQGGCPLGDGRGHPGYRFKDEISDTLSHDAAGIFSMANSGPDTNGSQFFITLGPAPELDGKHTVFGRVTSGLEVVQGMAELERGLMDRPTEPVVIKGIDILRSD
jgi:peptidyl-prolyl cis-trans isomerase A (cyclophilin A)